MVTPLLELEGTWEEISARASEFSGRRLRIIVLPSEEGINRLAEIGNRPAPSAHELLKLPPDERSRILEQQAALAESLYRTAPELKDFEVDGDDVYDQTP